MRFSFLLALCLLIRPIMAQDEQVRYAFPKEITIAQTFDLSIVLPLNARSGMARLQFDFPKGFEVQEGNNGGALFTYASNLLQLLWVQLPSTDSLRCSVKVQCLQGFGGKVEVPCRFYFIEAGERKEVVLNSCKFSVSGEATKRFTPIKRDEQKVEPPVLKTNTKAPSVENKKQSKEEAAKEVEQKQNPMPGKDKPETKAKVAEQPKPVQTEKVSSIVTKVEETNKASESKPKEKSANGISFRIQLAASSEKSPLENIASRFNLKAADVREELHNGMYKYTTGSFTSLAGAREAMGKNSAMKSGCFIAGYENGTRIALEDAIRLAKNK